MSASLDLPSGLVTFLFTDIEGSTRLAQLLGAQYRPVLAEHRQILRRALGAGAGVALFTEGDSVFAAFPDANAAVLACAEAQRALSAHEWPDPQARPRVRMGLHSGFAEPASGEYATPEVHRAARVAAAAHGGQVLCSAATARLATELPDDASLVDLGLYQLRGFDGRERLFQLVAEGLERTFPRPRTLAAAAHNLPAPAASFIGRSAERVELRALLSSHRLVNVVGPGGAGKTRLALEVASEAVPAFADGVWFVDLAAVTDPYLVGGRGGRGAGHPSRAGPAHPRDDHRLRRAAAAAARARHVRRPPHRRQAAGGPPGRRPARRTVLATSREPLGAGGELVWRIPPMGTLSAGGGRSGRGRAAARPGRRRPAAAGGAGPMSWRHLQRVAQRLDGLPLALELAAARLRLFSASSARRPPRGPAGHPRRRQRPDRRVRARHGGPAPPPTLRATVDWSYRTLPPEAANLLRQLSVFAGAVDLATVEWFAGPGSIVPAGDAGRQVAGRRSSPGRPRPTFLPRCSTRSRRSACGRCCRRARSPPPGTGTWRGPCTRWKRCTPTPTADR